MNDPVERACEKIKNVVDSRLIGIEEPEDDEVKEIEDDERRKKLEQLN